LECLKDGTLLVGGLDISYAKEDDSVAYAALCVFRLNVTKGASEVDLVDELCCPVTVDVPYVNSFLAFREVPAYQTVVNEFLTTRPCHLHPHVFMVDGNGTLHPRAFGSACHLGVVLQRPTFGVAKDLAYLPPPPPATTFNKPDVSVANMRQLAILTLIVEYEFQAA
uniref:Endonuclease V n=1 Tax=Schistocephalus solidus TaxID=70667 RepID=A0A183SMX5_SCHSO